MKKLITLLAILVTATSSYSEEFYIIRPSVVPSVRNGGCSAYRKQDYRLVRNYSSIVINGKTYHHYVIIDDVTYSCKDRQKIVKALTALKAVHGRDIRKFIKEVYPENLKDPKP